MFCVNIDPRTISGHRLKWPLTKADLPAIRQNVMYLNPQHLSGRQSHAFLYDRLPPRV